MQNNIAKYSSYQFIGIICTILALSVLLITSPSAYDLFSQEDHLFEYGTAVALFAAGIFLIRGIRSKIKSSDVSIIVKGIILLVGVVFMVAAGEEISWGQRIFGLTTPEELMKINDQNELNFHNINKKFYDRLLNRLTILFTIVSAALMLFKVDKLFEIKMPSITTICAFITLSFYYQFNELKLEFVHAHYIAILLLIIAMLRNKTYKHFTIITVTILMTIGIMYFNNYFSANFPSHNNSANEYREALFGIAVAFYAYEIMRTFQDSKS